MGIAKAIIAGHFWKYLLLATLLPLLRETILAASMELDADGGYGIVVAIDPSDSHSDRATEYIGNMKAMMQEFNQLLWELTNSVFHIKSVDILVPDSWVAELNANVSVKATYHGADIQISEVVKVPLVENWYPCGKPGVRIQLPTDFVNKADVDAIFGSQAKGLLNLWLRYRFGVWEEHGYPGHKISPYMYNLSDVPESQWRLTSCNNTQLNGDFAPTANDTCTSNSTTPIGTQCRFHPYPDLDRNNANSSVMNFHWVESLTKLCDAGNHDRLAPNRQNLYCNVRSMWQVIESSSDYQVLEGGRRFEVNEMPPPPQVELNVVGTSPFPLLYILLDRRFPHHLDDQNLYLYWLHGLEQFIYELPVHAVVKLVRFPWFTASSPSTDPGIQTAVDWSLIDTNLVVKDKLYDAIKIPYDPTVATDFRLGISQALAEVEDRNHPHGVLFLVLRTDVYPFVYSTGSFGQGTFEHDYILDLKKHGVTMCAVEIGDSNNGLYLPRCLVRISEESGGISGQIDLRDPEIAPGNMRTVLQFVLERVSQSQSLDSYNDDVKYEVIYQKLTSLETQLNISVLIPKRKNFEFLHIYATINRGRLDYIEFDPVAGARGRARAGLEFSERSEYFERNGGPDENLGRTYFNVLSMKKLDTKEDDRADGELDDSWGLKLATGEIPRPGLVQAMITVFVSTSRLESTDEPSSALNSLNCEIFTSAINDQFACSAQQVNEEPLAIYAKLTGSDDDGSDVKPVFHLHPTATIVELGNGTQVGTELNDGGFGADLFDGDGVYSGFIYPSLPGLYEIHVSVYETKTSTNGSWHEVRRVGIPARVLPKVLQTDLTDIVTNGTTLNTPCSAVFKWPHVLRMTSVCNGKKYVSRVTDLRVESLLNETAFTVAFTIPTITIASAEIDEEEPPTTVLDFEATASLSNNLSALVNNFGAGLLQHFTVVGVRVGEVVTVTLLEGPGRNFLAIQLTHADEFLVSNSLISNVVRGWRPLSSDSASIPPSFDCGLISCTLAIGIGSGIVVVSLLLVSLLLGRKNRAQKSSLRELTRQEVKEFLNGVPLPNSEGTAKELELDQIQSIPYDSKYEIPANKLHIDRTDLIGSGAFGDVYKGYVVNFGGSRDKVLIVAVKTMKPGMDKSYFKAMLAEVKLMTLIGNEHPNVVKLVGASTKNIRKCEVFLATEFCPSGNLSVYLRTLESEAVTAWSLLKWSREIANGMEYLGRKRVIHGDLAARNILLDSQLIAKISDFGLSKQLVNYNYGYRNISNDDSEAEEGEVAPGSGQADGCGGLLLPWKWLAPEALAQLKFTVASDVWAYGIAVWEIFGLCRAVPYPGVKWSADFVYRLEKDGLRLQKPGLASDAVYELMMNCWELEPSQRPAFGSLKNRLDEMMMANNLGAAEYMQVEGASAGPSTTGDCNMD